MANIKAERNGHEWAEERLSDYIDNRLPSPERAQLERHLAGCERCQASLASLKWTVLLLKQAPAPKLPRSFYLPVTERPTRAPILGLSVLRLATALATLLLFSLIGIDAILQFGGAGAPAARTAAQPVAPPQVALGVGPSPSSAADKSAQGAAPAATAASLPAATAALPAATAALPAAPQVAAISATPLTGAGAATPQPTVAASQPFKASVPTPTAGPAGGGYTPNARAAVESASPTQSPPGMGAFAATPVPPQTGSRAAATPLAGTASTSAPTAVPAATSLPPTEAPSQLETAGPTPSPESAGITALTSPTTSAAASQAQPSALQRSASSEIPLLRIGELGLLFLAVFLGSLTILVGRRNRRAG